MIKPPGGFTAAPTPLIVAASGTGPDAVACGDL